eukprot:jgi/Undpi1/5302/HiC_scaffold_2.g00583.m1
MAKGLAVLLCLSILLGTHPARARRAVGRRDAVETVVTARGAQGRDTDEWGEDFEDDVNNERPPATTSSSGRPDTAAFSSPPVPPPRKYLPAMEGPVEHSVEERRLVTKAVSAASVLREHQAWHSEEGTKRFSGETLGYVTPWNGRGYDFARTFRSKLDYVSPAWYQLRGWSAAQQENGGDASSASPTGVDMIFSLAGGHDFDEAWVSDVRDGVGAGKGEGGGDEDGGVTKIVPRVVLEIRGRVELTASHLLEMAGLLVEEAILRGYHGYVLDVPVADGIEEFVSGIKLTASEKGINLLIIQSVRPGSVLSRRQLERLVPLIHRFSLMTYDFHHVAGAVGADAGAAAVPNSPLPWVKETVEAFAPLGEGVDLRGMVLLGLPFYGYEGGRALSYNDAVSILKGEHSGAINHSDGRGDSAANILWHAASAEHFMSYTGVDGEQHLATYPTLAFIQERINLAQELGVGLALWELGQGMPYFFDLF